MSNSELNELFAQLKLQKNRKGEISRQFKQIEKGSPAHQDLLDQMKLISHAIDQTEASIKSIENANQLSETTTTATPIAFSFLEPQQEFSAPFTIEIAQNETLLLWNQYLQTHPSTPYHQSNWLSLIKNVFDHPSVVLIALDEKKQIVGGLPLTIFSSRLFGRFAVSIPYINYGGPISDYRNINQALISHCRQLLIEYQLSHVEVRSIQENLYPIFTAKKASMILPLPKSIELFEKSLGAKLRSQYKKAEDYSPKVCVGKLELLDDFYQVFSRNMRDLGTPVYSKRFFATMLSSADIQSTLIIIKMRGRAVSAAFLIGNGNVLEIPWASTIAAANQYNMNMWLYRQVLGYAINQQYDFFDFGRSTIDAGTYKFKKQWGAEPRQHYWYYVMPEGQSFPEINPNNPKYKLFIALWKLMPVWLTKIIGPLLIKHIP